MRILFTDTSNTIAASIEGIVFCDSWQNFILLGLVVHDGDFFLLAVPELPPEERVPHCDGDGQSVELWNGAGDEFSDEHHSSVADSWISVDLEISIVAHLYVLIQQISLGNTDVVEQHKSVLFGMEAYLRADVAAFDPWEPVVVCVLDLN